jgi:hypothetical protein
MDLAAGAGAGAGGIGKIGPRSENTLPDPDFTATSDPARILGQAVIQPIRPRIFVYGPGLLSKIACYVKLPGLL